MQYPLPRCNGLPLHILRLRLLLSAKGDVPQFFNCFVFKAMKLLEQVEPVELISSTANKK